MTKQVLVPSQQKGLGRGLSSLLGTEALAPTSQEGLKELYLTQLVPSKSQPRRVFDEAEIMALGQSIRQNGVLQPILARKTAQDMYEIIAGERRWRAAKAVGMDRLPVLVRDMSDEEVLTVALVENLQRENLNAIEEACGYERLLKKLDITQEELSRVVGKSRSHITNMCRLLQLPEKIQQFIESGDLTPGHGKVLVGVEGVETVVDMIVEKKLSVRQTEKLIQRFKKGETLLEVKEKGDSSPIPPPTAGSQFLLSSDVVVNSFKEVEDLSPEERLEIERMEKFVWERVGWRFVINPRKDGSVWCLTVLEKKEELDNFLAQINTITI